MTTVAERLEVLQEIELNDDQPSIEGPSVAISLNQQVDTNFAERAAYEYKFASDILALTRINDILARGDNFVNQLYTYRSCSKALPQVKGADDPNKNDIHTRTFEVLQPEVQKVKDLYAFHIETSEFFCQQVKGILAKKGPEFVTESLLWALSKLLDMLALLDALRNMKACLITDFSFFKRSFSFLKPMECSEDQTLHTLSLFLAQQNSITTHLKCKLQDMDKMDEVLSMLVNLCATYVEEERYVVPEDKHTMLRVISYGLFLMDGTEGCLVNIFKHKKINMKRVHSIFKKYPIVPLYGDMQIQLEGMIKSSPNFVKNEKEWPPLDDRAAKEYYEIIHSLPLFRSQYFEYMGKFCTTINTILLDTDENLMSGDVFNCVNASPEQIKSITNTVLEGMQLLSSFVSRVLQQSAWKYSHPNTDGDAQHENSYEQVVRLNYSKEERFALTELIGMIKGLTETMMKHESKLNPIIRTCVNREIQELVHIHMKDIITAATKKKKPQVMQDLLQIRTLIVDSAGAFMEHVSTTSKPKKSKSSTIDPADVKITSRAVAPSATQLELFRSSIYSIFCLRINGKRAYTDKEIPKEHMKAFEDFYARSYIYPFVMNYRNIIEKMTDLGDLWYREFYLELTKRLQFPIELSLPWILTDTILESRDRQMLEYVLYPLDIYNDAANRALSSLSQQFLYDEIEAEVNLCFDQLIFKLSDQVYSTFKTHAASLLLDNPFRSNLEQLMSTRLHPPQHRYSAILRQRHFHLLGRFLDLNELIAQRLNNILRKNVDNAISRFEAKDLTSIVELESQLNCIELTHHLLSSHFTELDPFEMIFNEVNDSSSLVSFHSRIIFHVIFELVSDFFPSFNFNSLTQRFVKNPISFGEEVQRENMPKASLNFLYGTKQFCTAYAAINDMYSHFVGLPHLKSLIAVVKNSNLPLIIDECLGNLELKVDNILSPYVTALRGAMPPSSKLPRYDYGVAGVIGIFHGKLKDIIDYPPLQSDVFQHIKEVGNTVAFLYLLDIAVSEDRRDGFMLSAPFLGVNSSNLFSLFSAEDDPDAGISTESTLTELNRYRAEAAQDSTLVKRTNEAVNNLLSLSEDSVTYAISPDALPSLQTAALRADLSCRPFPIRSSIFSAALSRISACMDTVRAEWSESTPEEGAVIPVDHPSEFYRLYSALQFIYCSPPERGQGEFDSYDLFGDGILWCACTVMHFLQQRDRFNSFDFAYHVSNVAEISPPNPDEKSPLAFLENASRVKDVNDMVFNLLDAYYPYLLTEITYLQPPQDDNDASQFKIVSTTRAIET